MKSQTKLIAVGDTSASVCEDGVCALPQDSEQLAADLRSEDSTVQSVPSARP